MKTELRIRPHEVLQEQYVFEVWHNNQFIGIVSGADGPGIRVVSKFGLSSQTVPGGPPNVVEVTIGVKP